MIRVEGLTKRYERQAAENAEPAVADLSFENETGQFLTLLGPSGCGKSTTLRSIAGLETPDDGTIEIGGKVVFSTERRINLSPARRRIGMVFQSYAIWPHMTVIENVAYPLRFTKTPHKARSSRARKVLEIVGLEPLADRPATRLSGGQQQRVALARALVAEPEVLLLDEPLSNLDTALRRDLGAYVRSLQQELGLTVIYVTHDQGEALSMSDTVALMNRGRIVEMGAPERLYSRPQTEFAASFLGDANFLPVTGTDGSGTAETPEGSFRVSGINEQEIRAGNCSLMIRPEAVNLSDAQMDVGETNSFKCEVLKERFFGSHREYRLQTEKGWNLVAKSQGGRHIAPHTWVTASVAVHDTVVVARAEVTETDGRASDGSWMNAPAMYDHQQAIEGAHGHVNQEEGTE